MNVGSAGVGTAGLAGGIRTTVGGATVVAGGLTVVGGTVVTGGSVVVVGGTVVVVGGGGQSIMTWNPELVTPFLPNRRSASMDEPSVNDCPG